MLKLLSINIPLIKALEKMPVYGKYIKDLVIKKRTMSQELFQELKHCSAIVTTQPMGRD